MERKAPVLGKEELEEFRQRTKDFYEGKITKNDYKGYSGRYGSYAQRGGKCSMIRLRMAGGRLTKDKLLYIAQSIEKYQVRKAHLTTCQTIQLHDLDADAVCGIMEGAIEHGIITLGGGGDFPRNVMAPPLSGTEKGEYFDVLPYAAKAEEFLLSFLDAKKMPRKLKVCFSSSPANVTHATFRDLGFVARPDGKFDVYSAGGLGNQPKLGLLMAEAVDPSRILYYILAMREVFLEHGNYEQRGKARTRYMRDKLGDEGYRQAYLEKLAQAEAGEDLTIQVEPEEIAKKPDGTRVSGSRVLEQKQDGLYSVLYHPLGGCPDPAIFGRLYNAIKDMEEVELRIAPDETLYIVNLTGAEAEQVLDVTQDSARTPFESSVACIGASICQAGVRDSQSLLEEAVGAVRKADLPASALPRVHISGCPSSCGTHQIGQIGFRGGVKMIDKTPHPAFEVFFFGCDRQGEERLGEAAGTMLQEDIPAFLVEVGKEAAASGLSYADWERANRDRLLEIAGKYTA